MRTRRTEKRINQAEQTAKPVRFHSADRNSEISKPPARDFRFYFAPGRVIVGLAGGLFPRNSSSWAAWGAAGRGRRRRQAGVPRRTCCGANAAILSNPSPGRRLSRRYPGYGPVPAPPEARVARKKQWHPVFAELLRPLVESHYQVETNVPVGNAPRQADFVLLRRTRAGP